MAFLARVEATGVSEYRACVIGKDGHITSFRAFVCGSDADATVWAKHLVDGHDVELWNGDRLVTRLHPIGRPGSVTHDVRDGRMIPKPVTQ
jgi:hypothetical protein